MRKVTTFSGKAVNPEPQQPSKSRLLCHVGDCDQIGTFSESSGPDAKFVCWVHDRIKPEDNHRLNEGIHNYRWLLNLCNRITVLPEIDLEINDGYKQEEINKFCEAKGVPELARKRNNGEFPKTLAWEPKIYWVIRFRNFTLNKLLGREDIIPSRESLSAALGKSFKQMPK